jgi:hypothetical protein
MADEKHIDDPAPVQQQAPAFNFSSLWRPARVNPLNLKSYTLPIFNLRDPYARNFHLFVASSLLVIDINNPMPHFPKFVARFPRCLVRDTYFARRANDVRC